MTIRTYRKRPVELQAVQFTGQNFDDVHELTGLNLFRFVEYPIDREIVAEVWDKLHDTWVGVKTDQWIMKGTKGEHWPVDNEVFVETYELVTEVSR